MQLDKIELKHLAEYLPYKLKVLDDDFIHELIGLFDNIAVHEMIEVDYSEIKPILRPLSDLKKQIEHKGEKFIPIERLFKEFGDLCLIGMLTHFIEYIEESFEFMDTLPYRLVQRLLEWHFDIFGLIENGLAIDKNTLGI